MRAATEYVIRVTSLDGIVRYAGGRGEECIPVETPGDAVRFSCLDYAIDDMRWLASHFDEKGWMAILDVIEAPDD